MWLAAVSDRPISQVVGVVVYPEWVVLVAVVMVWVCSSGDLG